MRKITNELIENFKIDLIEEEKAQATIEKYIRDILAFVEWLSGRTVEKQVVLEYKQKLIAKYAPASVNSVLSSLNRFFAFAQWFNCKVKSIKIQKQVFAKQERELTKAEYLSRCGIELRFKCNSIICRKPCLIMSFSH